MEYFNCLLLIFSTLDLTGTFLARKWTWHKTLFLRELHCYYVFEIFLLFLFNQQALAAEVIKTIRDIISLNPLYKEFLAQLIEGGKRVADNPVHLADFGKQQRKG